MKYLEIDYIKQHSRIDYDCEDGVLELYANAAEETVLNYLNRTYQDLLGTYGEVPTPIRQATLMLVDVSYTHRSPVTPTSMSIVPYTFDILVKPYMRLTDAVSDTEEIRTYTVGSQIKIPLMIPMPEGVTLEDIDFSLTVYNDDKKDMQKAFAKEDCLLKDDGVCVVLVDSDDLGVGMYMAKVTLMLPDDDFPDGLRRDVMRINTNIKVTG